MESQPVRLVYADFVLLRLQILNALIFGGMIRQKMEETTVHVQVHSMANLGCDSSAVQGTRAEWRQSKLYVEWILMSCSEGSASCMRLLLHHDRFSLHCSYIIMFHLPWSLEKLVLLLLTSDSSHQILNPLILDGTIGPAEWRKPWNMFKEL